MKAFAYALFAVVAMTGVLKDSRKYAATGGWGFGHFADGNLATLRL